MPHLVFECSEEIKSKISFEPIFIKLHRVLSDLLPTQVSSCKSRVLPYKEYLVGDDVNNLFIHLTVKILPGRSAKIKDMAGEKIIECLKQIVNDLDMSDVSISLEFVDLSESYYKDKI